MRGPLRTVQLNLAYDPALRSAADLIERYHTLTGWSHALSRAGALLSVVQRFSIDNAIELAGIRYTFVNEGGAGMPEAWTRFDRVLAAVRDARPEVVHVNGLMFPAMALALRETLPVQTAIVLQDHSGYIPLRVVWPLRLLSMSRWRRAFDAVDACSFTAPELADRWFEIGMSRGQRILTLPEASTQLTPVERDAARKVTGIDASPAILWVGRLDANKDPLTMLAAMETALPQMPDGRLWMIYGGGDLEREVRAHIDRSTVLRDRVRLIGAVPHHAIVGYYSAADLFVSASHHEGSGYALIEAMACGLTPCVTDIPAFRALTGACGVRWTPGDSAACAAAVIEAAVLPRETSREHVMRHFKNALHWDSIGRLTLREYEALVEARARSGAR